jgi:S-adenosylmethionine hydrolase
VGTPRAALAVASDDRFLVGPDNGVLSPALLLPGARAVELPVPPNASPTFHGRDVFAPAAAAIAGGRAPDSLGSPFETPLVRRTKEPVRLADGGVAGEIIAIDRFGNAITNILGGHGGRVEVGSCVVRIGRTFGEVPSGSALALTGSSGLLEIAVRDGNAARELELVRGDVVILRRGE